MFNSKSLSAISYLSIFFAPFLLPIILFCVSKEREVKYHAKRASISHLIPTILGAIISFFALMSLFSFNGTLYDSSFYANFMFWMFLYFVISIIIVIWNLVQAVRIYR
nr:DUF4870 domain-containing protein [Lysinibacillus timonensis]